jgi:hypothetical protein
MLVEKSYSSHAAYVMECASPLALSFQVFCVFCVLHGSPPPNCETNPISSKTCCRSNTNNENISLLTKSKSYDVADTPRSLTQRLQRILRGQPADRVKHLSFLRSPPVHSPGRLRKVTEGYGKVPRGMESVGIILILILILESVGAIPASTVQPFNASTIPSGKCCRLLPPRCPKCCHLNH